MFKFANPQYLYLLLALPLLVVAYVYWNIRKMRAVKRMGTLATLKQMMPELSLKRSYLKFWLTFTILVVGILMIARPQFGTKAEKVERHGIELVIALDVSNSMLAEDVSPSRLERSKQMLSKIIDKRNSDKVAIVVFAGEAYVQMPLTGDVQSARIFLENIDPSIVPVQGTDIGTAISLGLSCFSTDKEVDKAMIIITDGENLDGDALATAEQASEAGIRINVLGVGSPQGAPLPIRDNEGKPVISKLDEATCKAIAEKGQGLYARADNSNSALKALQEQLEKLRKKEIEGVSYSEYDEKFQILAAVIFLLLVVEICIFEKKNRLWRNVKIFKR